MKRRESLLTILALAVGAVGIVVAYGATWIIATVPVFVGQPVPTTQESLSGSAMIPLGSAAGWVALASAGGVIATRTWGRRLVGAVAGIAGAVAGIGAITFIAGRDALIDAAIDAGEIGSIQANAWWLLAFLGGLVVMVAGSWTLLRGSTWSSLGRRYERPGGTGDPATPEGTDRVELWDALDRGEDPTARS